MTQQHRTHLNLRPLAKSKLLNIPVSIRFLYFSEFILHSVVYMTIEAVQTIPVTSTSHGSQQGFYDRYIFITQIKNDFLSYRRNNIDTIII